MSCSGSLFDIVERVIVAPEQIDAHRDVLVEQVRLGKAQLHRFGVGRIVHARADDLPLAHEVALRDREIDDELLEAGEAKRHLQFARRLFSSRFASSTARSGPEPGFCSRSRTSPGSSRATGCDRANASPGKLLNASPSDSRISRRTTLSRVSVLPLISTRSMNLRGASPILKFTLIVSVSLSRTKSGFTSGVKPSSPVTSVMLVDRVFHLLWRCTSRPSSSAADI